MATNGLIKFDPNLPDESRGHQLTILAILLSILIIISTTTRLSVNLIDRKRFGVADYLIAAALCFNLSGNLIAVFSVRTGFGRHVQYLTREQGLEFRRLSHFSLLTATLSLWAVKISICFFILSLIQNTHRHMRWIVYGLIAVTSITSLGNLITWSVQARPLRKFWTPEIPGTVASTQTMVNAIIIFTVINSLTDLFYAVSPIYFIGRLQMSLQKRLIVIGLIGCGLLVFISSIIRVGFDHHYYDADFTWALHGVYIGTIIERNLAEIVADLPTCFTLFRNLSRKASTYLSKTRGSTKVQIPDNQDSAGPPSSENSAISVPLRTQTWNNYKVYHDDEIPLNKYCEAKDKASIAVKTSIHMHEQSVGKNDQLRTQQATIIPWQRASNNSNV